VELDKERKKKEYRIRSNNIPYRSPTQIQYRFWQISEDFTND